MTLSSLLISAVPLVLSLASRSNLAIVPCAAAGLMTLLFAGEPLQAALPWSIGLIIAIIALRERLRLISFWP